MKKTETYFIRHTWECSVDEKTRERMWNSHRVFIHFPWDSQRKQRGYNNRRTDSTSANPNDYDGSDKRAIKALRALADNGGYVAAHFSEHEEWMLGFAPPQKIKLVRGVRRSDYPHPAPKSHNGVEIIKTVRLRKTRLISPHDYAALQAAQPRQGTIMRWPSVGDLVESIVRRQKRQVTFDRLGANDQEILCGEFLRLPEARRLGLPRLVSLQCDIGRTMKDLDILGIASDGKRIMAQVTHYSFEASADKFEKLKKYQNGRTYLVLFCDSEKCSKIAGVLIFPIREVFERFGKTAVGKLWKKHVLT